MKLRICARFRSYELIEWDCRPMLPSGDICGTLGCACARRWDTLFIGKHLFEFELEVGTPVAQSKVSPVRFEHIDKSG